MFQYSWIKEVLTDSAALACAVHLLLNFDQQVTINHFVRLRFTHDIGPFVVLI